MPQQALRWGVCVPTLNAGKEWSEWLQHTNSATTNACRKLVIDSSSTDSTPALARQYGWEVISIPRHDFNHGGTRNEALLLLEECDVVVFLTQDALVHDTAALDILVATFLDPDIAGACGRQLPHDDATLLAIHARHFNYPATSRVTHKDDIPTLGMKTAFLSNSFSAYRRQSLLEAGGFPINVILGEDMLAGAKLLQAGWKLAYCAEAQVKHSHNYSLKEEFQRYFDIGVMHQQEAWLINYLGKAEGEGLRFVLSEIRVAMSRAPYRLPEIGMRTLLKYVGYRLGKAERFLPLKVKTAFSMHTSFWK